LAGQIDRDKGSGTVVIKIVRAGGGIHSDSWSDLEKQLIQSIDRPGIDSGSFILVQDPEPRKDGLWIGSRINLKERQPRTTPEGISFRTAHLRAASWRMDKDMVAWG
jgi:hypothetical protein